MKINEYQQSIDALQAELDDAKKALALQIESIENQASKLRKTQMLLESCLGSPKDMIILSIDHNYHYYYFNQAHKDAMKYAYGQDVTIETNLLEAITNETDRIKAKTNYDLAMNGTSHSTIQEYGDKAISYYETFYNPIFNEQHEIVGATAFARDISDRVRAEEALRQSEERFQMLFNKAPLGYQSLDINGCFLDVNQRWLETLGYSRPEVIGKWFGDFLSPQYQDGFRQRFPIFKAQGQIHSEFEMVHKNGNKLFIAFEGKIGYDPDGNFKQTHCILQDITEKNILEQKLKASNDLTQSIINSTTDVIYVKNIHGQYLLFNAAAEKLVGKTATEVLGKDDISLFPPDAAAAIMKGDRMIMDTAVINTIEETVTNAAGKSLTFLSTKGPIYDNDHKFIGLFGVARDITERLKMEKDLANEKKLLETTLISVGDGVISCDSKGLIVFMNRVAESLTGWTQETAKGRNIEEIFRIINEFTREQSENIVKTVIESGKINELSNHTILVSRDGIERPIEDSAAPIIQENGEILGVVLVFRDFSEKRQKQKDIEYLSYHDQLTGLYNRRFYEEELKRLDTERNLPLSIVMGDLNGLKLINDSFGHALGDELLIKAAEVIKKGCRSDDIVARLGGDEFVIILPKADIQEAEQVVSRLNEMALKEQIGSVALSISFGYETKTEKDEQIQKILTSAEDHMYRHKLYESSSMRSRTIGLIMNTLYEKNNREMLHSKRVSEICEAIASKMNFDKDDINQIRIAGLMHDIGKIGIDERVLNKPARFTQDEWNEMKRHSEIGYRILGSVSEFSEIASYVLEHQEKWNGTGYPKGLKGEDISVEARVIAVADAFDAMTSDRTYQKGLSEEEGIAEICRCSGTQFDPEIAKIFIEKVMGRIYDGI